MEKMVSHKAHNLVVIGSIPIFPAHFRILAQRIEHLTFNQGVIGSIPICPTLLILNWNNRD